MTLLRLTCFDHYIVRYIEDNLVNMALYAFDGTWNEDEIEDDSDTNVIRFAELYAAEQEKIEYVSGVGTRLKAVGRLLGGVFGLGGRTRIAEMMDSLENNWDQDQTIDIIGYSRGAALAVHFANEVCEKGIVPQGSSDRVFPEIRFLGLWDIVGSFGIPFNIAERINFQDINLGWNIDTIGSKVKHCFHAMALDERRESFGLTRLDPDKQRNNIKEVWFRGVHGDIGGSAGNPHRSNIALNWMLEQAANVGVPIDTNKRKLPKYTKIDHQAPISTNKDPQRDPRRPIGADDEWHPTAIPKSLDIGQSHTFTTRSRHLFNWSGIKLSEGGTYLFKVKEGDTWLDASIECDASGWKTESLTGIKEAIVESFEKHRRHPEANWFELIGAEGDEDDVLIRIGKESTYEATTNHELWTFANDYKRKYGNNKGSIEVTATRLS